MDLYDDEAIAGIIKDPNHQYNRDLKERLLDFSVAILKMLVEVSSLKEYEVLKYQLSKSSTSIGANYEEAQSSTYKEFAQKTRIALREANESKYWLKIIQRLDLADNSDVNNLISEVSEISKILGSIVSKVDKNINSK